MDINSMRDQVKFNLLVGTYRNTRESDGIYIFEFNALSGNLKLVSNTDKSYKSQLFISFSW
jgi:6-phosphogluconolactonase